MTFFQLIKEIFDNSRERIKTPITGAFFTALILYNWRPILQLMFSKMAVEDRIYIVDHEFIDYWSWLAPLIFAIGYITVVPFFTDWIDGLMVKNKESRIDKIYDSKSYDLDKRLVIAGKERDLKEKLTGNKKTDDYINEINDLKNSKDLMQKSFEAKIQEVSMLAESSLNGNHRMIEESEGLSNELSILRKELVQNEKETKQIMTILAQLTPEDLVVLRNSGFKFLIDLGQNDRNSSLLKLKNLNLVIILNDQTVEITELGEKILSLTGN